MSKWRVEIDISFNIEADAITFLNDVEKIKTKTFKGEGTELIRIVQKTRYHECFHDEFPPLPCGDYTHVDFEAPKKVHKIKEPKVDPSGVI